MFPLKSRARFWEAVFIYSAHVKSHFSEIVLIVAVVFMTLYPPIVGAVVFALALLFIAGVKALEAEGVKRDEKIQADIDKVKGEVERLILARRGHL